MELLFLSACQSFIVSNVCFCFPQQLQPSRCQYREGEEYCVLHHIQNGSYGDVFCVRDERTGFKCAAKRVSQETLSHSLKAQIRTTQRLSYNDSVKSKWGVIQRFVVRWSQIPLSHFSNEEVSTWSALNSPRVVELFGAVRDGLNIVLFMDLKPGELSITLNNTWHMLK